MNHVIINRFGSRVCSYMMSFLAHYSPMLKLIFIEYLGPSFFPENLVNRSALNCIEDIFIYCYKSSGIVKSIQMHLNILNINFVSNIDWSIKETVIYNLPSNAMAYHSLFHKKGVK